jgi:hypothetical protein
MRDLREFSADAMRMALHEELGNDVFDDLVAEENWKEPDGL